MKANKVLLNIVSVFCFLFGACYIFSLVFIPIGIYCFSAGKLFSSKADHLLDNFVADKKLMRNYTIFISIVCFPFGLLSVIAYLGIYGNNVKVQTAESVKIETVEESVEESAEIKTEEIETEKTSEEPTKEETEEEKLEKLEKLRKFKDKNIISEEEFEMAKEQMFGKDKK